MQLTQMAQKLWATHKVFLRGSNQKLFLSPKFAKKIKIITKIWDNLVENQCNLIYAKIFTNFGGNFWWFKFSFEFLPNFSPISGKILVIWRNFWVTKMSPIQWINKYICKKITKIGDILLIWKIIHKKSENFSESINISKNKPFYSLKMSPNLVKNHSPKKVKISVNQQTSQELRMLSPSLCIQRSQCNCSYCCSQLSKM